jgi:hypothetical protein
MARPTPAETNPADHTSCIDGYPAWSTLEHKVCCNLILRMSVDLRERIDRRSPFELVGRAARRLLAPSSSWSRVPDAAVSQALSEAPARVAHVDAEWKVTGMVGRPERPGLQTLDVVAWRSDATQSRPRREGCR